MACKISSVSLQERLFEKVGFCRNTGIRGKNVRAVAIVKEINVNEAEEIYHPGH